MVIRWDIYLDCSLVADDSIVYFSVSHIYINRLIRCSGMGRMNESSP